MTSDPGHALTGPEGPAMTPRRVCRLCGGGDFVHVVTLDDLPVSHALRRSKDESDPRFRLAFECCRSCGLLQIVDVVAPEVLYRDTDSYLTGFHKPRHLD